MPTMNTYLIRDIDPNLWQQFKDRTTQNGHSIRWVLMRLIVQYAQGTIDTSPTTSPE